MKGLGEHRALILSMQEKELGREGASTGAPAPPSVGWTAQVEQLNFFMHTQSSLKKGPGLQGKDEFPQLS